MWLANTWNIARLGFEQPRLYRYQPINRATLLEPSTSFLFARRCLSLCLSSLSLCLSSLSFSFPSLTPSCFLLSTVCFFLVLPSHIYFQSVFPLVHSLYKERIPLVSSAMNCPYGVHLFIYISISIICIIIIIIIIIIIVVVVVVVVFSNRV